MASARRAENGCRGDTLRFYGLVPTGMLSAGCAALLVCGVAAAQGGAQSSSASAKHPSAGVRRASAQTTSHKGKRSRKSAKGRMRGQQKIDSARAREIQEALIREHYLEGTASGTWDAKSQAAMERYQADNGWQSKTVPDSRALIKLGLGPDHEHLLNPESAMTSPHPLPPASVSGDRPADNPAPATPPQK